MRATLALHVSRPCVHHPLSYATLTLTCVCSRMVPKGFPATSNRKTVSLSTSSVHLDYPTTLPCLFCSGRMFRSFPTHIVASRFVLRYGGSFTEGSALLYNGSAIVAHSMARVRFHVFFARSRIQRRKFQGTPVIYVNFNYRLGPLGFPQGEECERKSKYV